MMITSRDEVVRVQGALAALCVHGGPRLPRLVRVADSCARPRPQPGPEQPSDHAPAPHPPRQQPQQTRPGDHRQAGREILLLSELNIYVEKYLVTAKNITFGL